MVIQFPYSIYILPLARDTIMLFCVAGSERYDCVQFSFIEDFTACAEVSINVHVV